MNKTAIIIIFGTMALIAIMVWGSPKRTPAVSQENGAKSALTASENLHDFGTISMKNGDVTKDFIITNPTNTDIYVPSLSTSCMCTNAFIVEEDGKIKGPFGMEGMGYLPPANEMIKAGEKRIIRVAYDPNAHGPAGVGNIDRFITLTDESGSSLQLEIRATVTP